MGRSIHAVARTLCPIAAAIVFFGALVGCGQASRPTDTTEVAEAPAPSPAAEPAAKAQRAPMAPPPVIKKPPTPAWVWWEGERPDDTNFPKKTGFSASTFQAKRSEVLSEGDWLTNGGKRNAGEREAFATYTVDVPKDGTFALWTRKFWKHGPFKWRFDSGDWRECGRDIALADSTYIRLHLGANWVYLGRVDLKKGARRFELRLLAAEGQNKTACFDAFVLIDGPFTPRGKLKPDQKSGEAAPGTFAWEPDADMLGDDCPIDLRYLNEKEAGINGFVRREGDKLVLGDGRPARFWMIQGGAMLNMDRAQIDWWARRWAKYGVNLVRLGAGVWDTSKKDPTSINRKKLDKLHYLVSSLKKQGIYAYFGHVYWANWKVREDQGFPGYGKGKSAHSLLFHSEKMLNVYMSWAQALMTTENPYTGLAFKDDPAVMVYEIQNEDGSLFWTFNPSRFPEPTRTLMEKNFGDWLKKKYGSLDAARSAWGPNKYPHTIGGYKVAGPDDWDAGKVKLYGAGHLTGQGWAVSQRNPKRATDQLQFMVESQRGTYAEIIRRLRAMGVKCLVSCSNWKTADARVLDTLERHTYTAGDVLCRNEYYGVKYDPKPKRFYAVDVGDRFRDRSAMRDPTSAGVLQNHQMADYPHLITENNWDRPNRYRVEWPYLVATYGVLSGIDGWVYFAPSSQTWDASMQIWGTNDTTVLGQFPATALMFRRGDVKEAPVVVHEALALDDLYAFKGSAVHEAQGLDELWQGMVGADKVEGRSPSRLDPLAFFAGRMTRGVDGTKPALVRDLRKNIDRTAKVVTSVTDELKWDYGKGVVTVNTPRAQGAIGFLGAAGRIDLPQVTIECRNEYAAVVAVSLDGEPLARSSRILIQAGTEDFTHGFAADADGEFRKITALGGYPLNVKRIDASVTVKRVDLSGARVLDGNGYFTEREADVAKAPDMKIRLPADALYTVVY